MIKGSGVRDIPEPGIGDIDDELKDSDEGAQESNEDEKQVDEEIKKAMEERSESCSASEADGFNGPLPTNPDYGVVAVPQAINFGIERLPVQQ